MLPKGKFVMKFAKSFALATLLLTSMLSVTSYAEDCKTLQDQKNVLYAAKGYCFKDAEAQAKYGADCHTKKPMFSDAESKRLAQIEASLKALNCPKKD
jgi:hypothetical protein